MVQEKTLFKIVKKSTQNQRDRQEAIRKVCLIIMVPVQNNGCSDCDNTCVVESVSCLEASHG